MPYRYRDIEKRLYVAGFYLARTTKGSHVIFKCGSQMIPVPNHGGKEITIGVEKNILRALNLTAEQFKNLI